VASFNHIGGAEPSTVTFKVATVTQTRNSSVMHQEILSIGDPNSSLALAAVLNAAPASTAWAMAVRIAGGPSSVVDLSFRPVLSSTAADNPVTAAQSGAWTVRANLSSTATDNQVTVANFSTAVRVGQSSQADLRATIYQSTAADLHATVTPVSTSWAGLAGFHFDGSGNLNIAGSFSASTTVSVSQLLDSSGGSVTAADSANNAIRVNVVAGAASGSTLITVRQSTAADLQATVTQASTTWAVQLSNYSTTINVSSLAGAVNMRSSAANALVTVYQSTAADLNVTVANFSTSVLATIGQNLQSTSMPSSGSSGLVVRQVIDSITTFASTSALASTTLEIASSGANTRIYVTAYTLTSTNQTPAHWGFFSSNGTLLWPVTMAALSSATCGANLAVGPPSYLFRTAGASDALNFKTNGSTVSGVQLGVSYFKAP
jgi:hypothetical protein